MSVAPTQAEREKIGAMMLSRVKRQCEDILSSNTSYLLMLAGSGEGPVDRSLDQHDTFFEENPGWDNELLLSPLQAEAILSMIVIKEHVCESLYAFKSAGELESLKSRWANIQSHLLSSEPQMQRSRSIDQITAMRSESLDEALISSPFSYRGTKRLNLYDYARTRGYDEARIKQLEGELIHHGYGVPLLQATENIWESLEYVSQDQRVPLLAECYDEILAGITSDLGRIQSPSLIKSALMSLNSIHSFGMNVNGNQALQTNMIDTLFQHDVFRTHTDPGKSVRNAAYYVKDHPTSEIQSLSGSMLQLHGILIRSATVLFAPTDPNLPHIYNRNGTSHLALGLQYSMENSLLATMHLHCILMFLEGASHALLSGYNMSSTNIAKYSKVRMNSQRSQ